MRLANDQLSMQVHVTITPEEDDDAYVRSFLRSYAASTLVHNFTDSWLQSKSTLFNHRNTKIRQKIRTYIKQNKITF
jgi:hypothetical protein